MKNENENEKATKGWRQKMKEKRFYLYTAVGCAVVLLSLIIVAVAVSLNGEPSPSINAGENSAPDTDNEANAGNNDGQGDNQGGANDGDTEKPVVGESEEMVLPVTGVAVSNDYGFYYNETLNYYHDHAGLDFAAEAGTAVLAVKDGVVDSIYRDDALTGTEIVIAHGDGLKSVYRFVDVAENLKVGDQVEQGQQIAVVSEPEGNEYKEGSHLHFEVRENDKTVDPTGYLTLEEK